MKKIKVYIQVVVWVCGLLAGIPKAAYAQPEIIPHKQFDRLNGLPCKVVYDLTKDNHGFIWLCTDKGVCRFDGKTFYSYTTKDGLCDNEILCIYSDSRGNIWCAGFNGKISVIENGVVNTSYDFIQNWKSTDMVLDIVEDDEQNVYLATERRTQIVRVDKNRRAAVMDFGKTIHSNHNSKGLVFYNGNLWLCAHGGLYRCPKNTRQVIYCPQVFVPRTDSIYLSKANKTLWFRDAMGLRSVFGNMYIYLGENNYRYLSSVTQVNERFVLIGFGTLKTILYDLQTSAYRTIKLPPNALVGDAHMDNEGNIWISVNKHGLVAINPYRVWEQGNGVVPGMGTGVLEAFKDDDGRILAANDQGQLLVKNMGESRVIQKSMNVPLMKYASFIKSKKGIFVVNNINSYHLTDELFIVQNFRSKDAVLYKDSLLFLRHTVGILTRPIVGKNVVPSLQSQNILINEVTRPFALCLRNDTLWYANRYGLACYDIVRQKNSPWLYTVPDNGRIEEIITWGTHRMVLCTSNHGIAVYTPTGSTVYVTAAQGLFDDNCNEIDSCSRGWIVRHPLGLSLVNVHTGYIKTLTELGSISVAAINSMAVFGNEVLFSTEEGLLQMDVGTLFLEKKEKRRVEFLRILSDEKGLLPDSIELDYADNRLKIDFALPEYNNPDKVHYQWRINGKKWSETSTTTLEFVDLSSGEYVLEVMAKAPGYGWSKASVLSFLVKTPFWRKIGFWVGIVVVLAFLVLLFQRFWYTRTLAREREKASVRHQLMAFEQKALNAMMNPHFVFNAMGSIQHLLHAGNTVQANDYLVKFSRLIRKSLETSQLEFCYLDDEIERLTLYLQLEKMRFGDRMGFFIEVEEMLDPEKVKIPTLILQTYVENAVIHGAAAVQRDVQIHIGFRVGQGLLHATVEDTGPGFDVNDKTKRSVRFGVLATEKRLELLTQITGKLHSVRVHSPLSEKGGTRVDLFFPLS